MSTVTEVALTGLAAVAVDQIRPSPSNPRETLTDIEDLAGSIRENGLIQPLVVQRVPGETGVQIVAGHRRYAACRLLGMAKVPCVIRRDMLPDEELLAMLVENGQRAALDPIEEARALNRLKSGGFTEAEVARKIGRPVNFVQRRLMLLQLPMEEQEEIRAGARKVTHAESLVRSRRALERAKFNPVARPVGRPKGATTKPYFGDTHPLAKTVRSICDHRGRPKVGGIGCGNCWEHAIRADADNGNLQAPPVSTESVHEVDESAVQRVLDGHYDTRCNPAEKHEVCRRWASGGRSLSELQRLTGWKPDRYYRATDELVAS